jgi:quinol monooxygenase YgiN
MATMFVRHTVTDYAAWRRTYDALAPMRQELGVLAQSVYQSVDNPNDVTVTHEFASPEAAKAYAQSTELRAALQRAGVTLAPTVWFASQS